MTKPSRYWLAITSLLLIAFLCLVYPIYVIRPFRHQGAAELAWALAVLRFRPFVEALCVGFALVWAYRFRRRVTAWIALLLVCGAAALSRVNVYELMFHPRGAPAFEAASTSRLDPDEMVVAINPGGTARAYPIRAISYHHIVNDLVGGVPIAATY